MKKLILLWLAVFLIQNTSVAQVIIRNDSLEFKKSSILNGLRKAEFQDLDQSQPLMLDGESIPVYTADFVLLKGDDFNKAMMSANFIPEPYVDNDKVVKLFLLRIASEQEKSQMIQYQEEGSLNNEFIGKPALPFSVTDLLGNAYSIDKLKGKLIVIYFWFVECKPCIMEMPDLNKLVEKYKNANVVFLGFANSNKDKVQRFLKASPFHYHIICDAQDVAAKYKIVSYPTHMIIDKNLNVAYASSGLNPTTISDIDKMIEGLIK